jgi:hypothetical protein
MHKDSSGGGFRLPTIAIEAPDARLNGKRHLALFLFPQIWDNGQTRRVLDDHGRNRDLETRFLGETNERG